MGSGVRITSKEIYDKLLEVHDAVIRTNGKVKMNRWIATTALTLVMFLAGCFFNHVR